MLNNIKLLKHHNTYNKNTYYAHHKIAIFSHHGHKLQQKMCIQCTLVILPPLGSGQILAISDGGNKSREYLHDSNLGPPL